MFVCCECRVLSGRGLCNGLITRPEESYRLWCVVCDQETSKYEEAKASFRAVESTTTMGCNARKTNNKTWFFVVTWLGCHVRAGIVYRGAGKSLARPEREQATVTEDFDFYISYL
jgi:hypothetical protein